MLTIDDLNAIAEMAREMIAEEFQIHNFSADPPYISMGVVRTVLSASARYNARKVTTESQAPGDDDALPRPEGTREPRPGVEGGTSSLNTRSREPRPIRHADVGEMIVDLDSASIAFRELDPPVRKTIIRELLRERAEVHGGYSSTLYLEEKPTWAPAVATINKLFDCSWAELLTDLGIGRPGSSKTSDDRQSDGDDEDETPDFLAVSRHNGWG